MTSEPKLRPIDRFLQALYRRNAREALDIGESILRENPSDAGTNRNLARLLTELEREGEATPYWSRLAAQEPSDIEACFHVAKAEMAQGSSIGEALAKACNEANVSLRPIIEPFLRSRMSATSGSRARHVAIAGVSYCGSTLFDRLLGGLPGVRSIGESHWLIKTYENRVAAPIDFTDPKRTRMLNCTVCGPRCDVLTLEFRTSLAVDHSNWYFRIAGQLGTDIIVSADKNPSKLIDNDPLLRMDMLVLFKSPAQAWVSQLDKLPKDMAPDFYMKELEKYIPQWCRSYEAFLYQFKPAGKVVFVSFDRFVTQPRRILGTICSALDLPFDEKVLSRTSPGHAIGGNGRAMARLRDNDYEVNILPLDEPRMAPEQEKLLADSSRLKAVHDEMMIRFYDLLNEYRDRQSVSFQANSTTPTASKPVGVTKPSSSARLKLGDVTSPTVIASPGKIARFPLPTIHLVHHEGIFGDFCENVTVHIAKLEQKGTPGSKIKVGFFKHLLASIDSSAYGDIQRTFLAPTVRDVSSLKYLDPVQWFDVKLNAAIKLDLHRRPPISILDLDTGPGHFAVIAHYFGHSALGTNNPFAPDWSEWRASMYDALCEIFGVKKVELRLDAFVPLRTFGERFDLVSAFMPGFSIHSDGSPWAIDSWRFLFDDIEQHLLRPEGGIFIQFANGRILDAAWEQMVARARWSNEAARYIYIDGRNADVDRPVSLIAMTPKQERAV